ncbi:hypothetical protein CEXT_282481 [Caerostris extrusa]|uniref:Uncharacterized protein n=1 Tax=Caerostris extrusa TaxID=172846 RepID=A0AAV4XPT9_CAEEX|nr:hypothetical protein CEXT_282481 [Caerostris extrusa]
MEKSGKSLNKFTITATFTFPGTWAGGCIEQLPRGYYPSHVCAMRYDGANTDGRDLISFNKETTAEVNTLGNSLWLN